MFWCSSSEHGSRRSVHVWCDLMWCLVLLPWKIPQKNAPHSCHNYTSSLPRDAPIFANMNQGALGQSNLSLPRMKGILKKDDSVMMECCMSSSGCKLMPRSKIYMKMEWSLGWCDSGILGACSKEILQLCL